MFQNRAVFGKQIFLILKIWLGYFLVAKLVLIFPHWKIPSIALFNYDLFCLIILLAIAAFLKEHNNRYIFLNLAIFGFVYLGGFFTIFLGKNYSIGNDYLQYFCWGYRRILISTITCMTIIYIPIDYLYNEKRTISKYSLTFLITLPISFLYFRKFFLSYNYLIDGDNYYKLFSGHIGMNFLAIFFIILYGYLLFYRDRPISGHVNLIVFGYLLFLSIDTLDTYLIYSKHFLPILNQLFLFVNLILFIIILIHYLYYLSSDFGRFYEDIRFSKKDLNIKIMKKATLIEKYIFWLQGYFSNFSNRLIFIVLMVIAISLFIYFYPYGYAKLNFIILITVMIILIVFLNILINKRKKVYFLKKNNQ